MVKRIKAANYDTRKPHSYLRIYEEVFEHLSGRDIRLLELGIHKGASLFLWRDYFEQGTIVGLDIVPVDIEDPTGRIHVYQGHQEDTRLLDRIALEQAPDGFDVIIDDCSHIGRLARTSFWHLFENHLKPGGIYAIEDFGTGYMPDWPDGRRFALGVSDRYRSFKPPLQRRLVSTLSDVLSKVIYRQAVPSHMYGMVGFVKELVDACCLNGIVEANWGEGHRRHSKVDRLLISTNLVVVVKSIHKSERSGPESPQ
ncbi:MAG: class I SAM-dependent methyltransferase [Dehalococcoidia bacterium]|nr:MAG: class I SAM-dependent methyltransferase [Dehalococcoidia bacterium]